MTDEIGTVTMYPKLDRREWTFTPAPDPRDAEIAELEAIIDGYKKLNRVANVVVGKKDMRIAELEAALGKIRDLTITTVFGKMAIIKEILDAALMPSPEGDMVITQEKLDA